MDMGDDLTTWPKSHCTAREEVKMAVQWKKEMSQKEQGYEKIELHHLLDCSYYSLFTLTNFIPSEVLHI